MIKSRMFLRSKMGEIVLAITDEVANHFSGLDLNELTVCSDYIANTFTEISFHEAFRNDVNKIVLEAVTSQNRDSIWDIDNKKCLAVSDFQKDWILKHYTPMYEGNEYLKLSESFRDIEKENLLLKERIMELTQKLIDQQREYDQRFCDLYDTNKKAIDKLSLSHNDNTWYIGELKKFIQHLQDYIAAKHLEENGLILEKFIQEENTNASKKESN